jgi:hypothetical protein
MLLLCSISEYLRASVFVYMMIQAKIASGICGEGATNRARKAIRLARRIRREA